MDDNTIQLIENKQKVKVMDSSNSDFVGTGMKTRSRGNVGNGTGTLPAQNKTAAAEPTVTETDRSTAIATAANNNNNSNSNSNSNSDSSTTAAGSANKGDNNSDADATTARNAAAGSNADTTNTNNDVNAKLSATKPPVNANNAVAANSKDAAALAISNNSDSNGAEDDNAKLSATDSAKNPPVNANNADAADTAINNNSDSNGAENPEASDVNSVDKGGGTPQKVTPSSVKKNRQRSKQRGKPDSSELTELRGNLIQLVAKLNQNKLKIKAKGGIATKKQEEECQRIEKEIIETDHKIKDIVSESMDSNVETSGSSLERKADTKWDARVLLCLSNIEEDGTLTVGAGVNATTPCVKLTHALIKTIVLKENSGVVNDTVMMATIGLKVPEGKGNKKVEDHVSRTYVCN